MNRIVTALALGQLVGLLGFVDPLYIPFILAGPLVTGAVAAGRGIRGSWIAALWASAGINMLWVDWVTAREDVAYHAVLSAVMALLALAGWSAIRLAARLRVRGPRVSA